MPAKRTNSARNGDPVSGPKRGMGSPSPRRAGVTGTSCDSGYRYVASVVIPVFNKAELTLRCLTALAENTPSSLYEVIIVDNGSTDGTAELLKGLSGDIKVISNETNQGFTLACNQGAESAEGKYLVFLNNDTEVQPGWLDGLIEVADSDSQVAAVGAKLIYPNGRLQEAGGIIYSDASGCNWGWGDDPGLPKYNVRREVDYCSGACLLVRTSFFREVGGFDLRYSPAYYEDTDLCFTARTRGYKVVFEPSAKVIHHEGGTAGRDTSEGYKHYQVVNREKFREKWAEVLKQQPSPPGPRSGGISQVPEVSDVELQRCISAIKRIVQPVHGWLNDDAGAMLYTLARLYSPNGTVVELGSWKGRSTIWLAHGLMHRGEGRLYSVDTWEGTKTEPETQKLLRGYKEDQLFQEFLDNITHAGVADYVVPLRGDTAEVSRTWSLKNPIGLLFIDACHEYEAVKRDFELWSPMVQAGGFIVFDDVPAGPGPTRLVTELPHWYKQVATSPNEWIVQKVE